MLLKDFGQPKRKYYVIRLDDTAVAVCATLRQAEKVQDDLSIYFGYERLSTTLLKRREVEDLLLPLTEKDTDYSRSVEQALIHIMDLDPDHFSNGVSNDD